MRLLHILVFSFICFAFPAKAQEDIDAFNAGMRAYKAQEYQNAVYAFENAIHFNPKNYQAYCMLGVSYILNDEPKKAEKTYLQAITDFPREWKAYILLAEFYETQTDYDKALTYYQTGMDLMPAKQQKTYQKKLDEVKSALKDDWTVSEAEKERIISNIIMPLDSEIWRAALVEKKESATHVVYGLKSENYKAKKWSIALDLTCTKTSKQDIRSFNRINEWLASSYRKSGADMDTLERSSTSRLYETNIYKENKKIIGYIFPVRKGFCIAQFMYKKKLPATELSKWQNIVKKIVVKDF